MRGLRLGVVVVIGIGLVAFGLAWHWSASIGTRPPAALRAVSVTAFNRQGAALTQTIHDEAGLRLLQRDLQSLAPRLSAGVLPCPGDDGSHYRAIFSYANGRVLNADIRRTGCEAVAIGGRWAPTITWSNPQLLRDLDHLFPPEWQAGF